MPASSVRRVLVLVTVAVSVATAGRPAAAEEEAIDPTGGLRGRAGIPDDAGLGVSREQLVHTWDLDGNGTIDASEAGIARARMRRARQQIELDRGIDPLTGKPRVLEAPGEEPADAGGAADTPEKPRKRATDAPPGTRIPDETPTVPSASLPAPPSTRPRSTTADAARRPAGGTAAAGPSTARPGYGSRLPVRDLNAGLPRSAIGGRSDGPQQGPRGGLLPGPRSPARPRVTPPAAPRPGARVSADDIGGP